VTDLNKMGGNFLLAHIPYDIIMPKAKGPGNRSSKIAKIITNERITILFYKFKNLVYIYYIIDKQ
jgi:hypothetical protein